MMNAEQTIKAMIFEAEYNRVLNRKLGWTVWTEVEDVLVRVTAGGREVEPIIEMTDGVEIFRTSTFTSAVVALSNALAQ